MTNRYEGKIEVQIDGKDIKIILPSNKNLPNKNDFNLYSIYETNGKRFYPVTKIAQDNLDDCIKKIQSAGFTAAKKDGNRKTTSIKYGILTYGIEDFKFV